MNTLKNSDAGKLNTGSSTNQIHSDLANELRLRLEESQKFMDRFQRIKELLAEIENPEDKERFSYMIQKLFDLQIATDDLYSFFEFATKYQEYMSDVMGKYQNHKSELIADYNVLYVFGLYRKYVKDAFEEFSGEFRKCGKHSYIQKYLLPYSKFEKCIFYHAHSLCYNRGIKSPNYDDVNKMISIKPYGDSSLYPQNEIWQIVGFPGDSDHNEYRDYYCGLVLRNRELTKKQSEDIANGSPVQANNFKSKTI